MKPTYQDLSIKNIEKSRAEISASIPAEIFESYRAEALKNLNDSVTVDGFRKGKVPESVLVQKLGDMAILEEMAELAVSRTYPAIVIDQKIDAVGKPQIRITKIARGNPLEFTATTAVVPAIPLPDYKAISLETIRRFEKEKGDAEKVSDAELEETITKIRESRVSHEGHDHAKMTKEEHDKAIKDALPELTDDFARTLGDFKDVPDFKEKLSKLIVEDKRAQFRDKLRVAIADAILEKTLVEVPDVMIESEVKRTEAQFNADLERMNVKLDDYLKHAKKSIEDLRAEWKPSAEKKARLQLVINVIAEQEKLAATKEEVKAEADRIIEHYPDADREHAEIYAETILTNDKVFRFLEHTEV